MFLFISSYVHSLTLKWFVDPSCSSIELLFLLCLFWFSRGQILNLGWHSVSSSSSASSTKKQQTHLIDASNTSPLTMRRSVKSVWAKHFPFLPLLASKNEKQGLMLLPSVQGAEYCISMGYSCITVSSHVTYMLIQPLNHCLLSKI